MAEDVPGRLAGLEYRVMLLENLLAPQLAAAADAQVKAAAAGVAAQAKAEADARAAEEKAAAEKQLADSAAQSAAAQDYLRQLLAQAQQKPAA